MNFSELSISDLFTINVPVEKRFRSLDNLNEISLILLNILFLTVLLSIPSAVENIILRHETQTNNPDILGVLMFRAVMSPVSLIGNRFQVNPVPKGSPFHQPLRKRKVIAITMIAILIFAMEILFIIGQAPRIRRTVRSGNDFGAAFGVNPPRGIYIPQFEIGTFSRDKLKVNFGYSTSNLTIHIDTQKKRFPEGFFEQSDDPSVNDINRQNRFFFVGAIFKDNTFYVVGNGETPFQLSYYMYISGLQIDFNSIAVNTTSISNDVVGGCVSFLNENLNGSLCGSNYVHLPDTLTGTSDGMSSIFYQENPSCTLTKEEQEVIVSIVGGCIISTAAVKYQPQESHNEDNSTFLLPRLIDAPLDLSLASDEDIELNKQRDYVIVRSSEPLVPTLVLIIVSITLLTLVAMTFAFSGISVDERLHFFMQTQTGEEIPMTPLQRERPKDLITIHSK